MVLHGVATLKVRKGAFDALNKGSGGLRKRSKVVTPSGRPLKNFLRRVLSRVPIGLVGFAVPKEF